MGTDVVLEVARHIQGEAAWSTGQILVAWVIWCRVCSPHSHGYVADDAVLHVLGGFNGYNAHPGEMAMKLGRAIAAWDSVKLLMLAADEGVRLDAPYYFAMGQIDVNDWGWEDGEIVSYNPNVPGEAVHLYQRWPRKRAVERSGRVPEGER